MRASVCIRPGTVGSPVKSPASTNTMGVAGYAFLNVPVYPALRARPPRGLCGQPQGSIQPATWAVKTRFRSGAGPGGRGAGTTAASPATAGEGLGITPGAVG